MKEEYSQPTPKNLCKTFCYWSLDEKNPLFNAAIEPDS